MTSKTLTPAQMVVRKGARKISSTETPVELGKLQAYGAPAYSVTRDSDGGKWSKLWLRFSEETPALTTHMTGLGWKFYDRRSGWGHADDAQGQADLAKLTSGATSPKESTKSGARKSETKTAPKEEPVHEVAKPTQVDAPTENKTPADTSKRKLDTLPFEEKVKLFTPQELQDKLDTYAHWTHLLTQEIILRGIIQK